MTRSNVSRRVFLATSAVPLLSRTEPDRSLAPISDDQCKAGYGLTWHQLGVELADLESKSCRQSNPDWRQANYSGSIGWADGRLYFGFCGDGFPECYLDDIGPGLFHFSQDRRAWVAWSRDGDCPVEVVGK